MSSAPSRTSLLQYSFIALPLSFAGLPLYIHAPDFYTHSLGMNIGLIGIILLSIRLFDAFQDPVIGYLSDKHAGKRFHIIMAGLLMLTLGMGLIFYGPQLGVPIAVWFAVAMILATTGFSAVVINLNMIGGFWHDDTNQRTRISGWREAFTLTGLLIASILPAALQNELPAQDSFRILFWTFSGILVLALILFSFFMRSIPSDHVLTKTQTDKKISFLPIIFGTDRHFFGVYFLSTLANAIPSVIVLFFIRDYLGAENLTGLFLLLYFITGAALMVVWIKLSQKIGKVQTWLFSMIVSVLTFIWAFFLQPGDLMAYGFICVLSGMSLGADLALPPAILADRVSRQKNEKEATQYYAVMAFLPKTSLALASGFSLLALNQIGFQTGTANDTDVMHGVITIYALIPCIVKLLAALYLWRLHVKEGDSYAKIERNNSYGTHGIS